MFISEIKIDLTLLFLKIAIIMTGTKKNSSRFASILLFPASLPGTCMIVIAKKLATETSLKFHF